MQKGEFAESFCLVGITSLRSVFPSSAGHQRPKAKAALREQGFVFSRVRGPYKSELLTGHSHTKKAQSQDCAFAFGRDSVGIRTQDPQLRRLLLYPTELPNRSLYFSKVAAKICYFFEICNLKVKVLLRVSIISTIPRGLF